MKKINDKTLLLYGLILIAILSRLIPHPANFTPVAALGVFAGAYISDRRFWLVPLVAIFISDMFIGFYQPLTMLFVYIGFAASAFIGRILLLEKRNFILLGGSAVLSATIFFIFSNLGVWLAGLYYPLTLAGLVECFVLAIPFFGNTLFGDFFYMGVLFGAFEAIREWSTRHQELHTA